MFTKLVERWWAKAPLARLSCITGLMGVEWVAMGRWENLTIIKSRAWTDTCVKMMNEKHGTRVVSRCLLRCISTVVCHTLRRSKGYWSIFQMMILPFSTSFYETITFENLSAEHNIIGILVKQNDIDMFPTIGYRYYVKLLVRKLNFPLIP